MTAEEHGADNHYWDLISSGQIEQSTGKESMKDLIREAYDTALPLMHELLFVEADVMYLNLVCGVPQTTIAGIS